MKFLGFYVSFESFADHFKPKNNITTSTYNQPKTFNPKSSPRRHPHHVTQPNPEARASSVPIHRSLSIWSSANSAGCGWGWDGMMGWEWSNLTWKSPENPYLVGG